MPNQSSEFTTLLQDLRALGIQPGDAVLVHSSMKALGTSLAPEEVITCLQEAVGDAGTLLIPALTYENVNAQHPDFHSETTPPCIGLLPTTFWRMPGVERSLNPTHSVCARGRLAHRLTVGHEMDSTAVGPHSPFMQLAVVGGKLLFIGDVLHACTFLHGVEEMVQPPYLRPVTAQYTVNGAPRTYTDMNDFGWGQEFQRIGDMLEEPDIIRGKLLHANSFLIDTRALLAVGLMEMRANPYTFVTDISKWV
ncbi:AAC(3) family N-acetyltransferase [Acutalibacter caecimuris]|uniref:AAC(3) family N-acetyltransferase n=1 Tax=Acutalibacter caecimuris TaxID=3093657 RepID=UPI002AC9AAD1|nr:AAC(3) family N-acetyltransferase [Acutalibacter sp. M00118]